MINIIVPPIIIILVIASLITIFARAIKTMDPEDEHIADEMREKQKEQKRKKKPSLWQRLSQKLKRTAYHRQKKATLHEKTQKHSPQRTQKISSNHNAVSANNQPKLSRMGELILSYHKGGADGENDLIEHDTQEAMLVKNIEANPKNPDAYQRLGDYYMEMHKYEDARESYKYVLRINPRHRRAQEAMKNLDRVLG